MKITIYHSQSDIDPSATVSDEQFPSVLDALESEYRKALLEEFPDADIYFEDMSPASCSFRISGLDDPRDAEDIIQRIIEDVYSTGNFWA